MRQSNLFFKTQKDDPKGELAVNAKLLIRAKFIDKLMAGVFSMLPMGFRVREKIINIIREEMNAVGGQEIIMPALHPRSVWEATNRWNGMSSVMYQFTDENGKEWGLGPTHEEVIAPLAKYGIDSYVDMPKSLYQIQVKFRNEERPKSGLLRGREFTMKDLYSFHADEDSLNEYYDKVTESYHKIFKRVGLGDITYLTFASGGSFSKYSHEFQTLSEIGEDTIYVCEKCNIAVNKEIIDKQETCPKCGNKNLAEKRAIEVGNIFKLGTKFSDPVGLTYTSESGEEKPVIMASYGIGIERLMGTIVEIFHDEKGIIWPQSIAPFQVHLLMIGEPTDNLKKYTEEIYKKLEDSSIETLYDDRSETSAGEKFAEADLIGIPWRLVISEKTLNENKVEIKRRDSKEESLVSLEEAIKTIKK
jgi:prolyl-tRNA synthetase